MLTNRPFMEIWLVYKISNIRLNLLILTQMSNLYSILIFIVMVLKCDYYNAVFNVD